MRQRPRRQRIACPRSCPALGIWFTCQVIFTFASAAIRIPRWPIFGLQRSMKPISRSAMRRVFIQPCTTRTTFTSCGHQPRCKAKASCQWIVREEWSPTCGSSRLSSFPLSSSSEPCRCCHSSGLRVGRKCSPNQNPMSPLRLHAQSGTTAEGLHSLQPTAKPTH